MSSEEGIRQRIEARITQGEFIAGLLLAARRESAKVQGDFVSRLSHIAAGIRDLLEPNGYIQRLVYRPREYWPSLRGRKFSFLDGGVANIELPSAAPIGIRVCSYTVRPGDETEAREKFNIELSLVDDLFSDDGITFESDFLDIAKLRDAARMASELAAGYRLAKDDPPDGVILHGPLVNPAAPYGLADFPAFGLPAARTLLCDPEWTGNELDRKFVALYREVLRRFEQTGVPVIGTVERSIGKYPVVVDRILKKLQDDSVLKEKEAKAVLDDIKAYGLNDATLLDVVLQEGEYVTPLPVDRQGPENKWPEEWKTWIRQYPKALTTYLKPSDLVMPFRIEAFESNAVLPWLLDLVLHTSRLLPTYGFPVGLDIVDRFAKVPAWLSRGVKGQHQIVLLQKALATGDLRVLTFAKRVLAARGRDWLFRPTV